MGTTQRDSRIQLRNVAQITGTVWGLRYSLNYASERARRAKIPVEQGCEAPPGLWPEPAYVPPLYYWRERYFADFTDRNADLVLELQAVRFRSIIRADHTGPVARKIGACGGMWVANITNGKHEVASYALVASDARENVRGTIVRVRARHDNNNGESLADDIYVDEN